eukprot:CAMPEP_0180705998 /NCGR_PEP_ID=MMETSP1038_2-20121128/7968_1 /TAXON_ID=632150 /ORGANISM="Azadinium spinosum, Strain 3D9" /LENGTH=201 /DNA_ID=CAMNT_0022737895 /DNA_START=8 /DNA_END=610 /DNA_ORIENTATION=-
MASGGLGGAGKETLPSIADVLLPKTAQAATKVSGEAALRSNRIDHLLGGMDLEDRKGDVDLRNLYELVDKLRVAAKDAQNLVDKSLVFSHNFVPVIEASYPCASADHALQSAHRLHMSIGAAKHVIGNPPGGTGDEGKTAWPLGNGAADLLAEMERKIGRLSGSNPDGLHQALNVEIQAAPVAACLWCHLSQRLWSRRLLR